MSNFLEKEKCSIHNQSCIAVDFTQTVDADGLIQCVKCMADKLSLNHSVLLNDETIIMLKEIKQKQFERKKIEIEQQLEKYQTSITKIQDYIDWQNGCLNKILIQFNSEIESLKNQLNQIIEPKVEDLEKSDLQVLQQILNGLNTNNLEMVNDINQERTRNFCIQVEKQLKTLDSEDKFKQIQVIQMKQLMKNKYNSSLIKNRKYKTNLILKTPFLHHECSKHGLEIVMFTLDEDYQEERMLCIDCIPNVSSKLTTIKEANNIWQIHQGKIYDSNNEFLNRREQMQQQIQNIIFKYQEKDKLLNQEIIQLIEIQNQNVKTQIIDLENNKNKKQLMQLEYKEIKNIINLLAENDRLSKNKEFQIQLNQEDQNYQNEIFQKLIEIEKLHQNCKQELIKLFNFNDSLFQDTRIQIERLQNEIQNQQLDSSVFTNLIRKNEIKDQSIQTEINIKVDQQAIDIKQQIGQSRLFSINSIKTEQIKCKINKFGLKDQSNQTGTNLKIDSLIIVESKKILKPINFEIAEINEHRYYYYNFKSLKFSTSLKHSSITISADGKIAKLTSNYSWQLCLCDQPIPKYGTVVIDFKVKQLNALMAGVCLIDSINKDYVGYCGIGKGCYLLYQNSFIYSHHDKEKDSNQLGFPFKQNDIISMEVNVQQKQITWRNKVKNQVYTLDIQTTSDLYFCFNFCRQNEIELL